MSEKPTLSIALLENEKIRGDVNAHLSVSGHRLELTSSSEGRKALKVVRSSSGADVGLMIAPSLSPKKWMVYATTVLVFGSAATIFWMTKTMRWVER